VRGVEAAAGEGTRGRDRTTQQEYFILIASRNLLLQAFAGSPYHHVHRTDGEHT